MKFQITLLATALLVACGADPTVTTDLTEIGIDIIGDSVLKEGSHYDIRLNNNALFSSVKWQQTEGPTLVWQQNSDGSLGIDVPELPLGSPNDIVFSVSVVTVNGDVARKNYSAVVQSNDRIVYRLADVDTNNAALYVYNPETHVNTRLSTGDVSLVHVSEYEVSPDGQWIAYVADQVTDGVNEFFVVGIDGGEPLQLHVPMNDPLLDVINFRWLDNSQTLVFLADTSTDQTYELFHVNRDGSGYAKVSGDLGAAL